MRKKINLELKLAMKSQNKNRLSTLRLITAAIKDRDIAMRTEESSSGVNDQEIIQILTQMIKQRNDSVSFYEEGGRIELAESEKNEIGIIKEFLPRQLSENEIEAVVRLTIKSECAESIRDMGRVIGKLKEQYAGKVDFSVIAPLVKKILLKSN
tara:strand:- start:632 stop:1093 length:462 start_codon:yes stop_codon:yes gene_type:complete